MSQNNIKILLDFLNIPLDDATEIFERFAALPNTIYKCGEKPLERFVYIPGTRKDRVVLVAHSDTIWDKNYTDNSVKKQNIIFKGKYFKGENPNYGIGADDRAGCALLWALKDSGHSILIVDGEEKGKIGANFLKASSPDLFKEINRHQYMIEFDWTRTNGCLYNQVDNTKTFKNYISTVLKFEDDKTQGGTDLQVLCRKICGVNLGIGYYNQHTNKEFLVLSEWENTLDKVSEFLKLPQPKFRSLFLSPYVRFIKRCVIKLLLILKIKK